MDDTSAGTVELRRHEGIAILTLTRPSADNRITQQMAASTRDANPEIIGIGRDLYYGTRCAAPHDAYDRARFALMAALAALDEPA